MDIVSIVVLVLAVLAATVTILVYVWTGVPSLPTSPMVLGVVVALTDRAPRREIVDLGSGYGTLVLEIARRQPRASIIGYEVSPVPYMIGRLRLLFSGLSNVQLRYGNLFDADLATVDLVLCYLTRRPMARLREKLERELPFGAEVIAHTFALPEWPPLETLNAQDLYLTPVYRYARPKPRTPAMRHPWMERPAKKSVPPVSPAGLLEEGPAPAEPEPEPGREDP